MRCSTCAAFVEDDATSCTSCGSEIDASSAPPPLPDEFEAPAAPSTPSGSGGGGLPDTPTRRPDSGEAAICDGCQSSFPPMQLSRIHGRRLCDDCADRADRASGPHPAIGDGGGGDSSGSGRQPASGRHDKAVSKGPMALVAVLVLVLGAVAVYFTVIAPGANPGTGPATNSPAVDAPAPGPAPAPLPRPVPLPAPIKRPENITITGTLQPFVRTPSGDVTQIEFKDAVNDHALLVINTDRYVAEDLTPGRRYRVSFRAIRSDSNRQTVKYSLDVKFEPIESGG